MGEYNKDNSILYIASFIFGICSLLLCLVPIIGICLGIVAIFISIKADEEMQLNGETSGLAKAGLVTSSIGVIIATILSGILTGLVIHTTL